PGRHPGFSRDWRSDVCSSDLLREVVCLDIRMPIKPGFDFLVQFQDLQPPNKADVKIVILSSSLDPKDHKKVIEFNNVTDFYGKPDRKSVAQGKSEGSGELRER